jgi:hypothetical protein
MKIEKLKVVWKIIRKKGQGKVNKTYCTYIVQNENKKHTLRTYKGTKLFRLLNNTLISPRADSEVHLYGMYDVNDNLICVQNFSKVG